MTSFSKVSIKDMGYAKSNKRCIPKERYVTCSGMSEIKDAYPKKVCHMPTRHVKKREQKIAPIQRKRKREEMIHTKEFIHHPPKI